MKLHFVKPSLRRLIWTIVAVAFISCIVAGIAVSIGFINGHDDSQAVPNSEYVLLVVSSLTMWGPIYLLTAWKVSIPAIIGIGSLAACLRRRTASTSHHSERPVAADPKDPS